jgi:hypothetical protein
MNSNPLIFEKFLFAKAISLKGQYQLFSKLKSVKVVKDLVFKLISLELIFKYLRCKYRLFIFLNLLFKNINNLIIELIFNYTYNLNIFVHSC